MGRGRVKTRRLLPSRRAEGDFSQNPGLCPGRGLHIRTGFYALGVFTQPGSVVTYEINDKSAAQIIVDPLLRQQVANINQITRVLPVEGGHDPPRIARGSAFIIFRADGTTTVST